MTVVCVDKATKNLKKMCEIVHNEMPVADVVSFSMPRDAIDYIKDNGCDVLLTEIEMSDNRSSSSNGSYGIVIANEAAKVNPIVNTIFVTVCDEQEYAKDVMDMRPSGYITKPYIDDKLRFELNNLRYPI